MAAASCGSASDSTGSPRANRRADEIASSARQPGGVLRLRIGRAQIERLRRTVSIGGGGAEACDPADVGRAALVDKSGGGSPVGHARAISSAAEPTMRAGPLSAARTASRSGAIRGGTSVAAAGTEHLHVDVLVPGVDHGHDRPWNRCRAICGAAKPASVDRPIAGLPAASAMPRAAEMPTRRPVKLPGPVVTAMRSSCSEFDCGRGPSRARSAASSLRRARAS